MLVCSRWVCGLLVVLGLVGIANALGAPSHVADADREYSAVFSHPESPCVHESTTAGFDTCFGAELQFTEKHLDAFLVAVRGIVVDESPAPSAVKASGKRTELELLNSADRAWREYKKNLCALEFAGYEGGSGAASAGMECEYKADRQYVQQVADAVSLKTLAK